MFLDTVVNFTEKVLTWRKKRIMRRKKKQAFKSVARDWLEAFLWAAGVVLLINQYLFQAYMIPSSSMEDTLLISDRIFVNKMVYGPELLPGVGKLKGFKEPRRGEVFIFENPQYISRGTAFDIAQRIIYMLTLSFVDIDREPDGSPSHHFLIKRNIGVPGDRIRLIDGFVQFLPAGFSEWVSEEEFKQMIGISYPEKRMHDQASYKGFSEAAAGYETENSGIVTSLPHVQKKSFKEMMRHDAYSYMMYISKEAHAINPHDPRAAIEYFRGIMGWYIPEGWYMPLGDNRDNSKDGRYFGLINKKKVLGEAEFKYWPLYRFGNIK